MRTNSAGSDSSLDGRGTGGAVSDHNGMQGEIETEEGEINNIDIRRDDSSQALELSEGGILIFKRISTSLLLLLLVVMLLSLSEQRQVLFWQNEWTTTLDASADASAQQPLPPQVVQATLSYNAELRRHVIRGMWKYENSKAFPPQRLELIRNLDVNEDVTEFPKDGDFDGSFSLPFIHMTSDGHQQLWSRIIMECRVKFKFTPLPEQDCEFIVDNQGTKISPFPGRDCQFIVDGQGINEIGFFHMNGIATLIPHEHEQAFAIILRKEYQPKHASATVKATTPSAADTAK